MGHNGFDTQTQRHTVRRELTGKDVNLGSI